MNIMINYVSLNFYHNFYPYIVRKQRQRYEERKERNDLGDDVDTDHAFSK